MGLAVAVRDKLSVERDMDISFEGKMEVIGERAVMDSKSGGGSDKLFGIYLLWNSHSSEKLKNAEDKIFANIKVPFHRYYVNLNNCIGHDDKIWTLELNPNNSKNIPIVLLHGFGAGIAYWALNFKALSKDRPVYAFDLLGLSRSSRPEFGNDPMEIEEQFVKSIERWREVMKIEKFIFIAHSWGAFLATSYALKYSQHLEHLILTDPWGFDTHQDMTNFPLWKIFVAYGIRLVHGCFSPIRFCGPFGMSLIKFIRPDLLRKYDSVVDTDVVLEYIYHCVNNHNATAEGAFHRMTTVGPWPIYPMGERMEEIDDDLPITILYGSESWTPQEYGYIIKKKRDVKKCYTDVKVIPNSGHHIYSDNPDEFHKAVFDACKTLKSKRKFNELG